LLGGTQFERTVDPETEVVEGEDTEGGDELATFRL
jgi:hypothetical protein